MRNSLLSLLSLLFLCLDVSFSKPIEINGIAARVNGTVITKNELSFMLYPIYNQLSAQFPRRGAEFEKKFREAQEQTLNELIDRKIILDEFVKLGASIRPHLIDQEIKRQIRELYNGDEVKFRETLKDSRMTMEGYRKSTREKMIVQAMRAEQFSDAPPPLPNEINKEYMEIKETLRDTSKDKITFQKIFIPSIDSANPESTSETQLSLAEKIVRRIEAGESFEEMAKTYSKDAFADQGGHQKDLPRTDLSAEFASILFDSPTKKVIGPLLDPRGYTIMIIHEKNLGPPPSLNEVRSMIEERVKRKKTSEQYDRWIEARRRQAMIYISK